MDSTNQSLSIKTELVLLIITSMSLIVLNISFLKHSIAGTIASLIIIFITGYAVTLLLPLPQKEDISFPSKLVMSVIIGIMLIGLWGFLTSYAHLKSLNSTFQYLTIVVVSLVFVIKLVKILRARNVKKEPHFTPYKPINRKEETISPPRDLKEESSLTHYQPKNKKEAKLLKTARKAAQSEKDKISAIQRKPVPLPQKQKIEVIKINQTSKDLLIILIITLLSAFLIFGTFLKSNTIKIPFCIALLFFIPGYSILSFIFSKFQDLSRKKKVIGSVGVSTALFLGIGALRYLSHLEISSKTIVGILIIISAVFVILSYFRRIKIQKTIKKSFKDIDVFERENEPTIYSMDKRIETKRTSQQYSILPSIHKKTSIEEVSDIPPSKGVKRPLLILYFVVLALGIGGLVLSWIPSLENSWIRAIFIIPLIFILPGYALKELILSSKFSSKKSTILLSIFLSILISIMTGSLLGLIYPPQYSYHNICTSILSIITIVGMFGVLWINWRKTRRSVSSLTPIEYPDRTHEVTEELKQYSKEKKKLKLVKSLKTKEEKKSPETENIAKPERIPKKLKRKDDSKKETQLFEEDLKKSFTSPVVEKKPSLESSRLSFLRNDIFLVFLVTIITLISIYLPVLSKTPLREIFGLLFVLFIPGYVLTTALFPKKSSLDGIERLALSFGLSLGISSIIGLTLYLTHYGVYFNHIIIYLIVLTIILSIIALLRRRRLDDDERYSPSVSPYLHSIKNSFQQESRLDKILSIILIVTLILAVATTAYIIVKPKQGEKFTEFYILGPNGKASDYPTNLTVGQNGSVILGVVNHEYTNTKYKYVVSLNGTNITSAVIDLKPGEKWEKPIQFTPTIAGVDKKLEFILYKLPDENNIYRSLHLWVDVNE